MTLANSTSFNDEAERTLRALRVALAGVMTALPERVQRDAPTETFLGLDKKLRWRITRIVEDTDLFAGAQYLPGTAAMKAFARAASRAGAPASPIKRLSKAIGDFDRLIDVHAGDRAALDAMIAGLAREDRETSDLTHRRNAFRANRYIRGVEAATTFVAHFAAPSGDDPRRLDVAGLNGYVDVRQLRANVAFPSHTFGVDNSDGAPRNPLAIEAIDVGSAVGQRFGLIAEFTTQPMPEVRVLPSLPTEVRYELVGRGIGRTKAISYVEGHLARRGATRYRDANNPFVALAVKVRVPVEVLIVDLHLHAGTYESIRPVGQVFGDDLATSPIELLDEERYQLPVTARVQYLGRGPAAAATRDISRYAKMIQYVGERVGWDPPQFDVYRCRVEYPPMPSSVVMRYQLPEKPKI